jgi:alpha-amylase/alpha-mannosidase (GH57 family)
MPVALLLHMHQPDYMDPRTGRPMMPWVRLHACRGYTDVAALALEAGARLTINVVPSLLDQLQWYADGGVDRWEELSRVPAEHLGAAEVDFVCRRFVHGHEGMRRASARYRELERRIQAGAPLSAEELRDLQVWSNLAWMGVVARRQPLVQRLRAQDRGYSHQQLIELMDLQRQIVAGVLPLWRRLSSLSSTPYNHPILPLLIDFSSVRRAMPWVPDEVDFRWPEDARRQVKEGLDRVQSLLGHRPLGMWPSEGSVSPEAARLLSEEGLRWLSTDQGVLEASRRDGPPELRRAWRLEGTELHMLFRDRELSDRVGFVYAGWEGGAAAEDLVNRAGRKGLPVPVVLDGENPWESYPDAGEAFLKRLFASGQTLDMESALEQLPRGQIHELHSGSWIGANFAVWAGDPEDRIAWRLLAELRRAWQAAGCPEQAWPHIRAAEGSDWFWWYGPENHTEMFDLFDGLYRAHLDAGWAALRSGP